MEDCLIICARDSIQLSACMRVEAFMLVPLLMVMMMRVVLMLLMEVLLMGMGRMLEAYLFKFRHGFQLELRMSLLNQ